MATGTIATARSIRCIRPDALRRVYQSAGISHLSHHFPIHQGTQPLTHRLVRHGDVSRLVDPVRRNPHLRTGTCRLFQNSLVTNHLQEECRRNIRIVQLAEFTRQYFHSLDTRAQFVLFVRFVHLGTREYECLDGCRKANYGYLCAQCPGHSARLVVNQGQIEAGICMGLDFPFREMRCRNRNGNTK